MLAHCVHHVNRSGRPSSISLRASWEVANFRAAQWNHMDHHLEIHAAIEKKKFQDVMSQEPLYFKENNKKILCFPKKQTHHNDHVATCETCRCFLLPYCSQGPHGADPQNPQPLPILKASRPPPRPPRYEGLPPRVERPLGFSKCLSSSSPEAFRKSSKSFIHGNTKFSPALLAWQIFVEMYSGKKQKGGFWGEA